jgi:hypothetical protein
MGTDDLRLRLEREVAVCLGVLQCLQVVEVPIGESLIGQRPQPLSRLQFRGIRGQEVQMYPCWDMDLGAGMPARTIEHHQDLLARPRADRLGKLAQGEREGGDGNGWQQQPPRLERAVAS